MIHTYRPSVYRDGPTYPKPFFYAPALAPRAYLHTSDTLIGVDPHTLPGNNAFRRTYGPDARFLGELAARW